ncbi:hypothetical protein BDZ94DRAFT_1192729 [Collybia nuda]|uniref:TM7S3/TM198-like domain-containing protein n=1 Tax=Collybia nuda TaxID=64659 RepID=A0A9P5Y7J9_9AGAR|nr:hypothetical protein BDZ94DRAFT_1192729 [Collybia nuda]
MAGLVRLRFLSWILFFHLFTTVLASPFVSSSTPRLNLVPRANFVLNNATGELQVFNPTTRQPIPQGPATDGGGANFNIAALIWVVFTFLVGLPMSFAGIRGWRFTTGVGIGLSGAVCSWAAFINSVNEVGVPDTILTAIVLAFFFLGFIIGLFEFGRMGGLVTLGITGGIAVGIRIMTFKENLLISGDSGFAVNWAIIAFLGILGGLAIAWPKTQRAGILFASASVGTFLTFLGIDLVINKQSGLSRGLRFLFDRNSSHIADIILNGYKPPVSTQIMLGVSLALVPILAYTQHRVFRHPFSRKPRPDSEFGDSTVDLNEKITEPTNRHFLAKMNRFSL